MASLCGEMRMTRDSATSGEEIRVSAKTVRLRSLRNCRWREDRMSRQTRRNAPRRQHRTGLVASGQAVFKKGSRRREEADLARKTLPPRYLGGYGSCDD